MFDLRQGGMPVRGRPRRSGRRQGFAEGRAVARAPLTRTTWYAKRNQAICFRSDLIHGSVNGLDGLWRRDRKASWAARLTRRRRASAWMHEQLARRRIPPTENYDVVKSKEQAVRPF